jgi:CheY-like chemotaxis protein
VPARGSTFTLFVPLGVRPARRPARLPPRIDVMLASASPGVQRHLKTVLHDLHVEPVVLGELPAAAAACRLLLVDAPLLAALPQPQGWLRSQIDAGVHVAVITPLGADRGVDVPDGVLRLYKPVRRRALKAVLDAVDAAPGTTAGPREFMPSMPAAGPHVLVADDNAVNQIVAQGMLGQLGASSVVAVNGREALQCLSAERFDLVLMDMQMPELDGLAATRAWRASEAAAGALRTPIIAMTAHAAATHAQACRAAGMDGHLVKPFDMTELRRVLQACARERREPATHQADPRRATGS